MNDIDIASHKNFYNELQIHKSNYGNGLIRFKDDLFSGGLFNNLPAEDCAYYEFYGNLFPLPNKQEDENTLDKLEEFYKHNQEAITRFNVSMLLECSLAAEMVDIDLIHLNNKRYIKTDALKWYYRTNTYHYDMEDPEFQQLRKEEIILGVISLKSHIATIYHIKENGLKTEALAVSPTTRGKRTFNDDIVSKFIVEGVSDERLKRFLEYKVS